MDIKKAYLHALETQGFKPDTAQEKVVDTFLQIQKKLLIKENKDSKLINNLFKWLPVKTRPVTGLYLWGDVGRGKTWLMNLFMESLTITKKKRLHFHHFMLGIHEQLASMPNQKNPLKTIAKNFSDKYHVLCLDEFIVTNITDAMLLSGLLDALFENGVTLIATSNRIPNELYKNGLQRERFLPAIDLIKQHTCVMSLDGEIDHRLELLEQTDIYITPVSNTTNQYMYQHFEALATDTILSDEVLTIHNRPIKTEYYADEIAWFTFNAICEAPRAAADYIELSKQFHTIMISNIPIMDEYLDDKARRFIYFIDEMYDRSVKIIVSADAPAEALYTGDLLRFAFKRTVSRLREMRSEAYLSRSHRLDS